MGERDRGGTTTAGSGAGTAGLVPAAAIGEDRAAVVAVSLLSVSGTLEISSSTSLLIASAG